MDLMSQVAAGRQIVPALAHLGLQGGRHLAGGARAVASLTSLGEDRMGMLFRLDGQHLGDGGGGILTTCLGQLRNPAIAAGSIALLRGCRGQQLR